MARIDSAYFPGASFEAGKLNWPLASLTTVMVMVLPSFLALTSTPSIAPSSVEVTWPERAIWLPDWARRLVDDVTATVAASATACSRLRLCMMGFLPRSVAANNTEATWPPSRRSQLLPQNSPFAALFNGQHGWLGAVVEEAQKGSWERLFR